MGNNGNDYYHCNQTFQYFAVILLNKIINKFFKLKLSHSSWDTVPHHSRHAGNFPRLSGDLNRQFHRLVGTECPET